MKLRSLIAVLSIVIGAGSMTACSEMKGNQPNAPAAEDNVDPSVTPNQEDNQPSAAEILTRREANAHASLTAMKNANVYGDEQCSEDDVDSSNLQSFFYPRNGGIREVNPAEVINSGSEDIADYRMAVNAYAQAVEDSNNPYCIVRAAGTIAEQMLTEYSSNVHDGVMNASENKIERMELIVSAFNKSFEDAQTVISAREQIASNNDRLMAAMSGLEESMPQLGSQIQELETLLAPCHNAECAERARVAEAFVGRAKDRHIQVENYLSSLNSPNPSTASEDTGHQADAAERMLQDIQSLSTQAGERLRSIQAMGVGVVAVDPNQTGAQ